MSDTVSVGAFAALGPEAPSFRVRTRIPSEELAQHGVEMQHFPLFDERQEAAFRSGSTGQKVRIALAARRRLRRNLGAVNGALDVTLIQRQVDLLPSLSLERLAAADRRVVLDVDDAIWLDRSSGARGHPLAALKGTSRKVRWLASRADTVIAGNEMLAEWLGGHARQVVLIPSLVEHRQIPVRVHEPRERVVLGWIGSPTTAPSLNQLTGELDRLARTSDMAFELLVVGGPAPPVTGMSKRSEPWSEERERAFLSSVDIGLMPLPDDEWTRGKCAYKALQYMAAGIPVVADDVGVSAKVIGHEESGLIASRERDWASYLGALAEDPALRARLGEGGRERVARNFSVSAWAPTLAEALRGG